MRNYIYVLIIFLAFAINNTAFTQTKRDVIQFSGLVVGGDSAYGIPGVNVYIPKAGRGTVTNHLGYFSLATLEGDSIVIRILGFKPKSYVIPYDDVEKTSVIIELTEDTVYLPAVEIFPYPTERAFKEAFLAMRLPEEELNYMDQNLDKKVLKRMYINTKMDGSMNHTYFAQQQAIRQTNRYNYVSPLNLINPFAWAQFIQSVKRGDLKRKDWKDGYDED